MVSMVKDFFELDLALENINGTNITLIPKVDKLESISNFCPIGLCNFSYKIISKVLANRMKGCLNKCISPN